MLPNIEVMHPLGAKHLWHQINKTLSQAGLMTSNSNGFIDTNAKSRVEFNKTFLLFVNSVKYWLSDVFLDCEESLFQMYLIYIKIQHFSHFLAELASYKTFRDMT